MATLIVETSIAAPWARRMVFSMEKALWVSLKKIVHWLLFLVVALILLSGFGIVDYQVV